MQLTIKARRTAILLALVGLCTLQAEPVFRIEDGQVLLSEAYFPESSLPLDETVLSGLAAAYPHRVTREPPEIANPQRERPPATVELPRGIQYVRLYQLGGLETVAEEIWRHPALIVDARYVQAGFEELALSPLEVRESAAPAFVLMNSRTAGGLEIALQKLQHAGKITTVGLPSAGQTATWRELDEHAGWFVADEFFEADGLPSLIGTGLQPEVAINADPEDDYRGYFFYEKGGDLERLLKFEASPEDEAPPPTDPILQRAVGIIIALQALGELPEASPEEPNASD